MKRDLGTIPSLECRSEANENVDRKKRYRQILECFEEIPEMTAREVASFLRLKGYTPDAERNHSAPRLTELCDKGIVEQCGKKRCAVTGRTVTVYRLRGEE